MTFGTHYTWLVIEAGLKQAALWNFSVKIANKNSGLCAQFSGPIAPIDWSLEEVLENGSYLTLPNATISKLVEKENFINVGYDYSLSLEFMPNKVTV